MILEVMVVVYFNLLFRLLPRGAQKKHKSSGSKFKPEISRIQCLSLNSDVFLSEIYCSLHSNSFPKGHNEIEETNIDNFSVIVMFNLYSCMWRLLNNTLRTLFHED